MNKAFRILAYSERTETPATLIAVYKAKYFADKDNGALSMGPGGFVEALEYASGIKAHVVGKVKRPPHLPYSFLKVAMKLGQAVFRFFT